MLLHRDKIALGEIKLQEIALPPLKSGDYQLKSSITLEEVDNGKNVFYPAPAIEFKVASPRFKLESDLVHSLYPPSGSTGAYHNSLPHIVFNRKTLPWERVYDVRSPETPWLSLIMLTEKEINDQKIVFKEMAVKDLAVAQMPDMLLPELGEIQPWEDPEARVNVSEMPLEFFRKLAPGPKDSCLLTHCRQVDTLSKENTGSNEKGWYSSIICNRRPQAGENQTIILFSMEGHQRHFDGKGFGQIRLVVLQQWSFREQGRTLTEIAQSLCNNISPYRIAIQTKPHPEEYEVPAKVAAEKALRLGYMPMAHQWRNGQKSLSWYRGPFVPVDIPLGEPHQFNHADQALRFDEPSGMFDVSYSAAWQLGRVLAFADPGFIKGLEQWKNNLKNEKPLSIARKILSEQKQIKTEDLKEIMLKVETDEILTALMIEMWDINTDEP